MENKDITEMYNHNLHLDRLNMGKIAALTAFIISPIFYMKDVFMTEYGHPTLVWRMLPVIFSIIFLILTGTGFRNNYRVIKCSYIIIMYSILAMMFGIFYINYGSQEGRFNSFLIAGMVTTLLIIQLFSAPIRKHILGMSLTVIIFFIVTFTLKGGNAFIVSNLINPIATIILITIFSYHNEKRSFCEFESKVLLELKERDLINEVAYRKTIEKKLEDVVLLDSLTGIYNRRAAEKILVSRISRYNEQKRGYAIVFIDLDDLKRINDHKGHDEGDKYIISFTKIVREYIGDNKNLFRVGGDEFILFFEDESASRISGRMEELTACCLAADISFSYGIAESDGSSSSDFISIIKDADIKMYNQKRRKKQIRDS